jgi:tetratricopeptide (TPR) repeat protein
MFRVERCPFREKAMPSRFGLLASAALLTLSIAAAPALAAGNGSPAPTPPPAPAASDDKKSEQKATKKKKKQQQSEQQFIDGYKAARALALDGKYDEAIAAFHALGRDEHPDVANYIGFASRKLGRYDDAQVWYEKALLADSKHTRTWQYYAKWHLEQGNRLKAEEHLEKIRMICGTGCEDFVTLKTALDSGKISY